MSPPYLPTPPRNPWHRRTWNEHSTLTPELQAVKQHLLSRAQNLPTTNTTSNASAIPHSQETTS